MHPDIPLAGPSWTPADEPRLRHEAYTGAFRRFLCESVDRDNPAAAEADFEHRVVLAHSRDAATGAEVIRVVDVRQGRPILTFRRYRWEPLLTWLRAQGLHVAFARSSFSSGSDRFGMGVILLRNSETNPPS